MKSIVYERLMEQTSFISFIIHKIILIILCFSLDCSLMFVFYYISFKLQISFCKTEISLKRIVCLHESYSWSNYTKSVTKLYLSLQKHLSLVLIVNSALNIQVKFTMCAQTFM